MVKCPVAKEVVVPWSPEVDEALNRGVAAGMEFVRALEEMRHTGKMSKEVKEILDLAERAIVPKLNLVQDDQPKQS